jgi:hypothetical protein
VDFVDSEHALCAALANRPECVVLIADASKPSEAPAERIRASAPNRPPSSVMGVLSLGEACDRLLGFRGRARAGTLIAPERRAAATTALFDATIDASRLALDWSLVATIASGLLVHVGDDARAHFELTFVRDVALRHEGYEALLAWPDEDELAPYSSDVRFALLAHAVQSASDGGSDRLGEYATQAEALIGEDASEGALRLRGALGRALAAQGQFDRASASLSATVEAWLNLRPSEASRALCELLRVEGILGWAESVARWRERAEALVRPALDDESRRYLDLAIGRALVQIGEPRAALPVLGDESLGARAREHVRASVLRWHARAARALGDGQLEAKSFAELSTLGDSDQLRLAQLDRGLPSVEAVVECLRAMTSLPRAGAEVRAQLARIAPETSLRAVAERPALLTKLRDEYRY